MENLEEAARLADDYTSTHKSSCVKSYSTGKKFQSAPKSKTDDHDASSTDNASGNKSSDEKGGKKHSLL